MIVSIKYPTLRIQLLGNTTDMVIPSRLATPLPTHERNIF